MSPSPKALVRRQFIGCAIPLKPLPLCADTRDNQLLDAPRLRLKPPHSCLLCYQATVGPPNPTKPQITRLQESLSSRTPSVCFLIGSAAPNALLGAIWDPYYMAKRSGYTDPQEGPERDAVLPVELAARGLWETRKHCQENAPMCKFLHLVTAARLRLRGASRDVKSRQRTEASDTSSSAGWRYLWRNCGMCKPREVSENFD